jgi:hypothetical protein
MPIPSCKTSSCSEGSYSRDVKRAAWSSRQKSLRGFAKCAFAAADARPGLMPQKTTRRFGARTSGTSLRSFGFGGGQPLVEALLERATQVFAADRLAVAGTTGLEPDDLDGRIVVAVAPGIALGFRQGP